MNLLFLAIDVKPDNFAESTHVSELLNSLSKKIKVFICSHISDNTLNSLKIQQISRFRIVQDIYAILVLYRFIKINSIDIIYERRNSPKISSILSLITGIPAFYEVNGDIHSEFELINNTRLQQVFYKKTIKRFLLNRLKGLIFVCNELKDLYTSKYKIPPEKQYTIYNGVNSDLFIKKPHADLKHTMGINPCNHIVGYSGSFSEWQGLKTVIKVFSYLREINKDVTLLIIGDGKEKEELSEYANHLNINKYVYWTGKVSYKDMPKYLSLFDCAFMLKKQGIISSSPLKLYEYMSMEIPIIASNLPWFKWIEDENIGIIIDDKKTKESAYAINSLLNYKKRCLTMGKKARMMILSNNTWDIIANRIIGLLKKSL